MQSDYLEFDCCIGKCTPIRRGNIENVYYICENCIREEIIKDEDEAIARGYCEVDGRWIKKNTRRQKTPR